MRCGHVPLVLLAALAAAVCSSAGALTQAAPDAHAARAARSSILLSTSLGIYRRHPSGALTQLTKVTGDQVVVYPV
jgi:hypothetical protein